MEIATIFSALLISLVFFVIARKLMRSHEIAKTRTDQNLPPGPLKLPLIGNLHQMIGSLPHHAMKKLAQKYGPLMHLQLGELSTIMISSPRLAKEVLHSNGLAFANRPQLTVAKIILYNSLGVTFSQYGDYWKQMRHMYMVELLSAQRVKSSFKIMEDELGNLVKSIESEQEQPFVLKGKILLYLNTMISRCAVGRIWKGQDAVIKATRDASSLAGIFTAGDLFPSLKILQVLSGLKKKLNNMYRELDDILENIIADHKRDKIGDGNDDSVEDIVDILLGLKDRDDFQFPITDSNIKAIIFELFVAGTITSSVVVEWAISEMMRNPSVMKKAQAEVRQAFNGTKMVNGSDLKCLRYLKLVIKETLRLHPPGPLLAPRECREQCEVQGYTIPEKTVAIVNAWAIGRDPEIWPNPEKFEPERFDDSSLEFTGNHFDLMPFGAGRRMCPGISFGLANVELLLAQLLHHFDWKLPGKIKPEELDMTEAFGAAAERKNDLLLIATIHNPSQ